MREHVELAERAMTSDPAGAELMFLAAAAPQQVMSALELDGYLTGIIVASGPIQPDMLLCCLWVQFFFRCLNLNTTAGSANLPVATEVFQAEVSR